MGVILVWVGVFPQESLNPILVAQAARSNLSKQPAAAGSQAAMTIDDR
eukprot:COSAG01_NODE_5477_length_4236_cov_2.696157_4_plen_48_part_00